MMDGLKKYKVTVLDESYSLLSDESEDHVKKAACIVDNIIKEIVTNSSSSDIKKIAILTAIKLASSMINMNTRTEQSVQNIEKLIALIEANASHLPSQ